MGGLARGRGRKRSGLPLSKSEIVDQDWKSHAIIRSNYILPVVRV